MADENTPVSRLSDRDLLITTATNVAVIKEDVTDIKAKAAATNGAVAAIAKEQYKQDGAIAMLRWMVTATLAGIGGGAALAGVILAILARSH